MKCAADGQLVNKAHLRDGDTGGSHMDSPLAEPPYQVVSARGRLPAVQVQLYVLP